VVWLTPAFYYAATETSLIVISQCPRCDGELTTFTLADTEAFACEACGYAGVQADHTGDPTSPESWTTALQRFHDDS
jgi:hypothetical protein